MATKNKNKKPATNKIINMHWPVLLIAITPILLIAMAGYTVYLSMIVNDLRNSSSVIGRVIVDAIYALNEDIPIDPLTGDRYMYEVKLRLPPEVPEIGDLVYRFEYDSQPSELTLASKSLINQQKAKVLGGDGVEYTLSQVPALQSCARGIKIYFQEYSEFIGTKLFEKTLQDGRTIHAYQEDGCTTGSEQFAEYIKQLESY